MYMYHYYILSLTSLMVHIHPARKQKKKSACRTAVFYSEFTDAYCGSDCAGSARPRCYHWSHTNPITKHWALCTSHYWNLSPLRQTKAKVNLTGNVSYHLRDFSYKTYRLLSQSSANTCNGKHKHVGWVTKELWYLHNSDPMLNLFRGVQVCYIADASEILFLSQEQVRTSSLQLGLSWEATNCSATKELVRTNVN
jgi:hypothetical protein